MRSADVTGRSLLRDPQFRLFWAGDTVSQLGSRVSELALPLIAVGALHASATQVAWLTAVTWLPNLPAVLLGAWVDNRVHKRRLMVLADIGRAFVLLTLPAAYLRDAVTLPQLYVVALLTGAGGVLFDSAYPPFFAHLVPRESYLEANSKLSTTRSASYIVGPALGGALVQLVTAPVAVLADAMSFVASAVLVGRVHVDEPDFAATSGPSLLHRAGQGLRLVLRSPVLRAGLGCVTTINFFTFMSTGVIILFASRTLGLSAGAIGLAFGIGATGALVGAVLAPRISRRIGVGRAIAVGSVLFPAPIAIAAAAGGSASVRATVLAVSELLSSMGVMLFDVNLNSLITSVVPDAMRSRVSGAFSTVNYGIRPLGAVTGGLVAASWGLRPTLLIAAAGGSLSLIWLLASPVVRIRVLATTQEAGR